MNFNLLPLFRIILGWWVSIDNQNSLFSRICSKSVHSRICSRNTWCSKNNCSRGIWYWGNIFRLIFTIKVSLKRWNFQLFPGVNFFFLCLIIFIVTATLYFVIFYTRFRFFDKKIFLIKRELWNVPID